MLGVMPLMPLRVGSDWVPLMPHRFGCDRVQCRHCADAHSNQWCWACQHALPIIRSSKHDITQIVVHNLSAVTRRPCTRFTRSASSTRT